MGLDVSLYRCSDWESALATEKAYSAESEALYEKLPYSTVDKHKEARDAARQALNEKYDCGGYGRPNSIVRIEDKSKLHPDHMFTLGYWRSSYNSGGINNVLDRAIGKDLYYIAFGDSNHKHPDDYYTSLDWDGVKARTIEVRDELTAWIEKNGAIQVVCEDVHNGYGHTVLPTSESEAVQAYLTERADWEKNDEGKNPEDIFRMVSYGGARGSFYMEGAEGTLMAAIPGTNILGAPCIYNVFKGDAGDLKWYFDALDVVEEMADMVLASDDPSEYRVGWSG